MTDAARSGDPAGKETVLGGTALEALERFFSDAAVRGEKGLAIARLAVGGLALLRQLVLHGLPLPGQDPRLIGSFWILFALVVFSVWSLFTVRPGKYLSWRLRLSVAFDLLTAGGITAVIVVWPVPDWTGISASPEIYFLFLAVVASGLRLSKKAALLGIWGGLIVFLSLAALDAVLNGIWFNEASMVLGVVLVLFIGSALVGYTSATRTRHLVLEGARATLAAERARQRMGVYLSEVVATEALESEDLCVGGARQEVAVLFCDLRGFTRYSESLPPEQLVSELNAYLDAMVRAIRQEEGVVDKFIGDAVMVVFGVPRPRDDAALRAIRCAAGMQAALAEHNSARRAAGLSTLRHGIGLHYGPAVVGNIGNAERLQYTVVGDVVNLASRLETATKDAGTPVLISTAVVEAARAHLGASEDPRLPELAKYGTINVRGREGGIEVYTLIPVAQTAAASTDGMGSVEASG